MQLTIKAQKTFDDVGFPKAGITASNALDAYVVKSLSDEGVPVDNFGIGERLITGSSSPVLSDIYKLAEEEINDRWTPKIKASNNRKKITPPDNKQAYRTYRQNSLHQVIADVIALADEHITAPSKVANVNSVVTHASQVLTNFSARSLMQEYLGSNASSIEDDPPRIQQFSMDQVTELLEAAKRLADPGRYPVYLTATLAES